MIKCYHHLRSVQDENIRTRLSIKLYVHFLPCSIFQILATSFFVAWWYRKSQVQTPIICWVILTVLLNVLRNIKLTPIFADRRTIVPLP
jgi:hypothetical protein